MFEPANAAFFIPGHLKKFKLDLFNRIGTTIQRAGGKVVRGDFSELAEVAKTHVPIVGCTPELRGLIDQWTAEKRDWIYWDRGYFRRIFATWLPRAVSGSGYYRWHLNSFQMQKVESCPGDRWSSAKIELRPWAKNGKHVVLAVPSETYSKFHNLENWTDKMLDALSRVTDRKVLARHKESKRPLQEDLKDAHCLITHGSIAGVEAVILGCPVFTDFTSAAALMGQTDLSKVEKPIYPEREPWLRSLAYSQFDEKELIDGTLWRLLS